MELPITGTMVKIIINLLLIVQLEANPFFFGQQTVSSGASASDNFDSYANGALLESQANWAAFGSSSMIVVKPASDGSIRGNFVNFNNIVRRTAPTFAANHESEITFVIGDGTGPVGVSVRVQTGANTCYETHWDDNGNAIYLAHIVAGTWTQISTTSKNYSNGNKIRLEATGIGSATRLTVKEDTGSGWVNVFTSVDPGTYIDGGQPGVYGYSNIAGTLTGNNWSASDL